MSYNQSEAIVLAGQFPPALVTNSPDSGLEIFQTPVAYGTKMTRNGFLQVGSIPSGTTRIAKTYSIGGTTYNWYYNRLWRIGDSDAGAPTYNNRLIWGAPGYTANYYAQRSGAKDFNEDTSDILTFFPIGDGSMILFKSTGAYVIKNANADSAQWDYTPLIQEAHIATATHAVELDGIGYCSNTSGLFAVAPDGQTQEISLPVRGTVTAGQVLKADYEQKFIILGSSFAYDVQAQKWFDYRTAGSHFQSRTLQTAGVDPFCVKTIGFEIDKTDTTDPVEIEIATKVGNRDWSEYFTALIYEEPGYRDHFVHHITDLDTGRSFAMRIQSIPSTIKIKSIHVWAENFTHFSRDT